MPYCSVCDRRLDAGERECPHCGAPSTAVMGRLESGDEEWERLADDYVPAGRAEREGASRHAPGAGPAGADDPEWRSLVERAGPADRRPHAAARARGWWRRLRRAVGRG